MCGETQDFIPVENRDEEKVRVSKSWDPRITNIIKEKSELFWKMYISLVNLPEICIVWHF